MKHTNKSIEDLLVASRKRLKSRLGVRVITEDDKKWKIANEEMLRQCKIASPLYLTLLFNDYVKFGEGSQTKERMRKNHKHFFNELHRKVYKKSNKKIPRYIVIERGRKTQGFHSHSLIEKPNHLSASKFEELLVKSWLKTKDGVELHVEPFVYDKEGLNGYNIKQHLPKNTNAEVDITNSFTR